MAIERIGEGVNEEPAKRARTKMPFQTLNERRSSALVRKLIQNRNNPEEERILFIKTTAKDHGGLISYEELHLGRIPR